MSTTKGNNMKDTYPCLWLQAFRSVGEHINRGGVT